MARVQTMRTGRKIRAGFLAAAFGASATAAFAQPAAAPARPQFEVATIKQRPLQVGGMIGSGGPNIQGGRFSAQNLTLKTLISRAFGIVESQISGPDWIGQERYDISANVPDGMISADAMPMLRSLLEDRLKLTVHRESAERNVYALVVGKDGPKVHAMGPAEEFKPVFPKDEKGARFDLLNGTMSRWAETLSPLADRTVIDQTGLQGTYKFMLITNGGRDGSDWPNVFTAVQEELGLKLEARKAMLESLIVDRAEKVPAEN